LGRSGAQQTRRGGSTGGQLLCLANTHLYSHPEFPDVKLWQCYQLLHWLQSIVLAQHATALPLILCGDFNSEPASAVYELVAQRQVALDHADLPSEQASEAVLRSLYLLADHGPPPHSISHSLQLKSAYYMVQVNYNNTHTHTHSYRLALPGCA
jgi:CCR4-NOT transcription complex subunit 6